MDSASSNGSSPQTSNVDGGEDELDSRTNSFSSLFQSSSSTHAAGVAALQPPPPRPLPSSSSLNHHLFDFPSGHDFTPVLADLSAKNSAGIDFAVGQSSVQPLDKFESTTAAAAAAVKPPQSSKKRTRRASRRESTTVLTTDTSNFRAMVQEFTGFPASPQPLAAARSPYVGARVGILPPGVRFHDPPSPLQPPPPPPSFFQFSLPFMQKVQSPISSAGAAQSQVLLSMRSPNFALQSDLLQPSCLAMSSNLPAQLETGPRAPPTSGDSLNELRLPRGLLAPEDKRWIDLQRRRS